MSEGLKPCPFCGGDASEYWPNSSTKHYVQCNKCGARTAFYLASHGGSAKDDWNSRSEPSQARLSEAVKVLEEIAQMPGVNGGHYDIGEEFRNTQSLRLNEQCRVLAKRFLATLGEET